MATLRIHIYTCTSGALPLIPLSYIFATDLWHIFALTLHDILIKKIHIGQGSDPRYNFKNLKKWQYCQFLKVSTLPIIYGTLLLQLHMPFCGRAMYWSRNSLHVLFSKNFKMWQQCTQIFTFEFSTNLWQPLALASHVHLL